MALRRDNLPGCSGAASESLPLRLFTCGCVHCWGSCRIILAMANCSRVIHHDDLQVYHDQYPKHLRNPLFERECVREDITARGRPGPGRRRVTAVVGPVGSQVFEVPLYNMACFRVGSGGPARPIAPLPVPGPAGGSWQPPARLSGNTRKNLSASLTEVRRRTQTRRFQSSGPAASCRAATIHRLQCTSFLGQNDESPIQFHQGDPDRYVSDNHDVLALPCKQA